MHVIRTASFFFTAFALAPHALGQQPQLHAPTGAQHLSPPPRVPIHTAEPDPVGGAYGVWAAGRDYKVSFHDGMTFVPMLGATAPRTEEFRWRTTSVRVGATELLDGEAQGRRVADFRFEYRRGDVVEAYDVLAHGLEQTFVLANRPRATGDLVVEGDVTGTVQAAARRAAHAALRFVDADGRAVVEYGRAVAVDADGRRYPMTTSLDDGRVRLRLAAAQLAAARFPLVVDPLIGNSVLVTDAGITDVDVFVDAEQTTDNVWIVYSRAASATDSDLVVMRKAANLSGPNAVVYSDVQSSWSSTEGQLAGTGGSGAGKVVTAFTREFPISDTRRVRWHTHAKNDATLRTSYGSAPYSSGTHQWRPDVGGTRAITIGNHVLIAYQRESNPTFVNTPDSEVVAIRVDVQSGLNGAVVGQEFVIGNSSPFIDKEHPSVNQVAEGGVEYSWVVAWQVHGNSQSSTWNVLAQRVPATFGTTGTIHYVATTSEHEMHPQVEGADGRYLVAFTRSDSTTNKPAGVFGNEVAAQRVDWPHSALSGSQAYPARALQTSPLFTLRTEACAFDVDTRSHWSVLATDYATGGETVTATKVGYDGRTVEHDTAYAVTGTTPRGGGACFDDDGSFLLAWAADDGTASQPMLGTWQRYSPVPAPTLLGTNCTGTATVSHRGSQHIGSEFETFRVDSTLPQTPAVFGASLAPGNGPMDHLGMPGCTLSVYPWAPNMLGTLLLATDPGGDTEVTLPIPSALQPFDLFTQWFLLDPSANAAGLVATHGLRTRFNR